ncbi:NifB/NifX family molybdenum-iron cluster-binding protein [Desulforhabdus amnigena]|uniref:NifB/NifX family molybdenum-iron cluster-binding protein n=1 Tax=Desulforhabdus amnigena TaxID=40218 RepID=UPI0016AC4175|nr:hypothetical protein [Desulforhabdus amnigena]NLJ28123.1 hypothetical protein [Deltaproteobacteria bacterium]
MVAIPVFRDRVAPVLNWSTRVLIVPDEVPEISQGEEIAFSEGSGFELLRCLQERGVHTVICGALSRDLLCYGTNLGLKIICGVSGPIPEVLCAYKGHDLDAPRFWLPGCRGQRQYRGGCLKEGLFEAADERSQKMPGRKGPGGRCEGQGRGRREGGRYGMERNIQGGGKNFDIQDFCICPKCGTEVLHQRGIPCTQIRCPECDQPMVRK